MEESLSCSFVLLRKERGQKGIGQLNISGIIRHANRRSPFCPGYEGRSSPPVNKTLIKIKMQISLVEALEDYGEGKRQKKNIKEKKRDPKK